MNDGEGMDVTAAIDIKPNDREILFSLSCAALAPDHRLGLRLPG